MRILAIETSCDETAASVVEKKSESELVSVLSSAVATSQDMHVETGGIVPEVAAREQLRSMIPIISRALSEADVELQDMDALAVTVGPGLIGSLLVGVETTKALALPFNLPVIPVNHVSAHLYAHWVDYGQDLQEVPLFPALGLVISGGHTDIVVMKSHEEMKWVGGTRDDAAGECFDKTARVLNLPYPGGPSIALAAKDHHPQESNLELHLPRPMIQEDSLELSFSGLKTAVVNQMRQYKIVDDELVSAVSYEVQEAISDVLVNKLKKAIEIYNPASVLIAGGVSANERLREKLSLLSTPVLVPPLSLCTDNAVMIGAYAAFHPNLLPPYTVKADPSLDISIL